MIPSPAKSRAWGTATIGAFKLPPTRTAGHVDVSITQSIKVDAKKKAGAPKSKDTVQRKEPCPVKIVFTFSAGAWDQGLIQPIIEGLAPDGQPRDIAHPKAELAKVTSVLIERAGDVEWKGEKGTITWDGKEWQQDAGPTVPLILRLGSKGPEVTRWQTFLRGAPTNATCPADGFFGPETVTATKAFQTAEKIRVDGIAGPETFAAASKYGYVAPPPVALTGGSGSKTPKTSLENLTPAQRAAQNANLTPAQRAAQTGNLSPAQRGDNGSQKSIDDFLDGWS